MGIKVKVSGASQLLKFPFHRATRTGIMDAVAAELLKGNPAECPLFIVVVGT